MREQYSNRVNSRECNRRRYISSAKRRQIKRNRRMKFIVSAIAAVMMCLAFGSIFTYAKPTHEEKPTYKYYTSIQIEAGQTLTDIANEYMTSEYKSRNQYINEVMHMNHLSSDEIHAGCYIIVPYYSEELL